MKTIQLISIKWVANVVTCRLWNLSVSTAKRLSRMKSFSIIIKKPNISTAPNVLKNLHPLIQWSNTQEAVITSMLKEYQMLIQAKTISDWKFLVCKVSPDLRLKTGLSKMLVDTGVGYWKENRRRDWSNSCRERSSKRKRESRETNNLKTMKMVWSKKSMNNHNKTWTFHLSLAFLKTDH